jgi:HK97 family phage major capsid protein
LQAARNSNKEHFSMESLRELRNRRNKLLHDSQALCLKANRSAEDLAAAEKMIAECESVSTLIHEIENEQRSAPFINDPSDSARNSAVNNLSQQERAQQREDFRRFLVAGERRDLLAGSGQGAYLVPQEFYPVLTQARKSWGAVSSIVHEYPTENGAPLKLAFSYDVGNLLHESGEPASITEKDPSLSSLLSETDMLDTGLIKISVQELNDSNFDLDNFVRNNFAVRYARGLAQKITNGSLSGNIQSIVTGAYNAVVSAEPTKIRWSDVVALYSSLDPAYQPNSSWVMNSRTRGALLGVTDSLGRPLYIPAPSAEKFDTLLGRPVVLNQYLDDIAASNSPTTDIVALQFGDFDQGYLLRLVRPGLAIVRLNERFMDTLEVGFIGYTRAGGVVTDAGTHPVINLVQAN